MWILPRFKLYRANFGREDVGGYTKLYLIVIVLLFVLLVAGALFWVKNNTDNLTKKLSNQAESMGEEVDAGKVAGYQKKELEQNKTYLGYVALFEQSLSDYVIRPSDEKEKNLEELWASVKKDFPKEFNRADFVIPCIDEKECMSGNEPEVVVTLISEVKDSSKSPYLEDVTVKSLVALGSYEFLEESKAITAYNQAYKNCVAVLDQDKSNDKLKTSIVAFETLISEKFPTKYQFYKSQDGYKITNENVQAQ